MFPAHPCSRVGDILEVVQKPRLVALSFGVTSWSCREQETLDVDNFDKLKFGDLKGISSPEVDSVELS